MLCHNLILSLNSMLKHIHLCHHFKGKEISAQRCEAICSHVHPLDPPSLPSSSPPPFLHPFPSFLFICLCTPKAVWVEHVLLPCRYAWVWLFSSEEPKALIQSVPVPPHDSEVGRREESRSSKCALPWGLRVSTAAGKRTCPDGPDVAGQGWDRGAGPLQPTPMDWGGQNKCLLFRSTEMERWRVLWPSLTGTLGMSC